jgi:hypothetical protein
MLTNNIVLSHFPEEPAPAPNSGFKSEFGKTKKKGLRALQTIFPGRRGFPTNNPYYKLESPTNYLSTLWKPRI